jgi:hypothetical protein
MNIMSKDTSRPGTPEGHRLLADSELDAVSGGAELVHEVDRKSPGPSWLGDFSF